MSTFKYDIGDDDYPEYARKATFEIPSGNEEHVVIARRTHQGAKRELKGWVLEYLGSDPDSDWSLYRGSYCTLYPWDYNPDEDTANGIPDASNDVRQISWSEPTGAVQRYIDKVYLLLIDDDRIARTIKRYRQ